MSLRTLTRGALLSASSLLSAPAALAAGSANSFENQALPASSTASHVASSSGGSLVRTIVGLFIVIAVIYGITWVLKQVKHGRNRSSGTGLSSVANLALGKDRSLSLVRVGRDFVLLGVAEGSVRMIRTYTEEEAIELGVDPYADGDEIDDDQEVAARAAAVFRPKGGLVDTLRRMTVRS